MYKTNINNFKYLNMKMMSFFVLNKFKNNEKEVKHERRNR